jgi:hypothetical protein
VEVGQAHHRGEGRLPVRRWLGMSPADMRVLNADTIVWMDQELGHIAANSGGTIVKRGRAVRGVAWNVKNPA